MAEWKPTSLSIDTLAFMPVFSLDPATPIGTLEHLDPAVTWMQDVFADGFDGRLHEQQQQQPAALPNRGHANSTAGLTNRIYNPQPQQRPSNPSRHVSASAPSQSYSNGAKRPRSPIQSSSQTVPDAEQQSHKPGDFMSAKAKMASPSTMSPCKLRPLSS
ncbi:hypothetical protein BC831DRAFT_42598 [Entophlyctis helioformis]|nr:hypothetical protein BC831DRAFT_42598 [Entophlyctis helioformis]